MIKPITFKQAKERVKSKEHLNSSISDINSLIVANIDKLKSNGCANVFYRWSSSLSEDDRMEITALFFNAGFYIEATYPPHGHFFIRLVDAQK